MMRTILDEGDERVIEATIRVENSLRRRLRGKEGLGKFRSDAEGVNALTIGLVRVSDQTRSGVSMAW